MKVIHWIAIILVIIGALNWGLIGFFKFNLVSWIFGGDWLPISRIIYALVGLAGLWCLFFVKCLCCCEVCNTGSKRGKHH